jgi:hypothetical protein
MKYLKSYESIIDEYPGMFPHRKEEDMPQTVPGFELGTIDPEDNEPYNFKGDGYIEISDAESYKKFLKVTKERNFIETPTEIKINIKRLYHDFYMSIYNSNKHFRNFLNDELLGKYISDGYFSIFTDDNNAPVDFFEGIIEKIYIVFDDYSAIIWFKLKDQEYSENNICSEFITIDKIKSISNKYNI